MFLSKIKLNKTLIENKKRLQGRLKGKITVRHRGTGVKKLYRKINFKENFKKKGLIVAIEYDPYRNNFLAKVLLKKNGKYYYDYILCKQDSNVFQTILPVTNDLAPSENYNLGKTFYLKNLSIGDTISNIEKYPGKGATFARSAGCFGKIISLNEKRNLARVQLPSGEQYYISKESKVTLGKMANIFHQYLKK
jgi:large subunit ribosomal protein L2